MRKLGVFLIAAILGIALGIGTTHGHWSTTTTLWVGLLCVAVIAFVAVPIAMRSASKRAVVTAAVAAVPVGRTAAAVATVAFSAVIPATAIELQQPTSIDTLVSAHETVTVIETPAGVWGLATERATSATAGVVVV